jgi:hypothetical protein
MATCHRLTVRDPISGFSLLSFLVDLVRLSSKRGVQAVYQAN